MPKIAISRLVASRSSLVPCSWNRGATSNDSEHAAARRAADQERLGARHPSLDHLLQALTGGFRSDRGRDPYAGVRSVLKTRRRQDLSALQAIQTAIDREHLLQPG